MSKQAILFGSIGTLVETSDIQRQAFNQAFSEADLNWFWDIDEYRELLKKSGGQQRIDDYATLKGEDVDVEALHARKTEIFDAIMIERGLSLRDGVADVIQRAKEDGVKLAFVTTTSRVNVDAVFQALGDNLHRDDLAFVGDATVTSARKPNPDIYEAALEALALDAAACVAVEDTGISAKAPVAAGIDTIGFPGEYSELGDFDAALRITNDLEYQELIGAG